MGKFNVIARLAGAVMVLAVSQGFAAGGTALEHADIDPGNIASLQRGARNFMNYCSGCHSAQYVRFSTIGRDLELSDEQLGENLMFNAEKTFETINVSMPDAEAGRWFGVAPPDLSLIGRAKGADYIYSFLKGFYVELESPTGVNNTVLAGTSMPHVLWELQGFQRAVFSEHTEEGVTTRHFEHFEPLTEGSMDAEGFDEFVHDTVNFLVYIAEPIRSERRTLGVWVIMYLIFFWIIAVMLKKQIWKDVK
ncbi:MAG: cytochrome c1 [Gammaproteobacteria bacterium]|jgi:ubiquinol-cytochrome c reductase cytochrome c1 subunit|nr:cytochrome c1 [Gammaproteobacteria bacterium]